MDGPLVSPPRVPLRAVALAAALCALGAVGWRVWQPSAEPAANLTSEPLPPAPEAPTQPGEAEAAPTFDIVRVAPDGGLVIAGQAEPGSTVTVKRGELVIAEVTADARGAWVAVPAAKLEPGGGELVLSARNLAGQVRAAETTAVVMVPAAPGATGPEAGAPPLALLTTPSEPSRLLQPPPGSPAGGKLGVATVDYDDSGAIRFSGTAPPGAAVRVYIDNHAVGDATAAPNGRWRLSPENPVTPGMHRLRVDQLGARGRVAGRVEVPFARESLAQSQLQAGRVLVEPGQNLWRLARRVYGTGIRYTVIYAANRDQIRDTQRIYPGQVFKVPTLAP